MAECDKPLFQTALTVQVGDVNYGGHLANDAVLRLCHEVRMRWLTALGWSEMDAGGAGLIMADAAVQYLAQGHHGDELSVEMGAAGMAGVGFSLLYRHPQDFRRPCAGESADRHGVFRLWQATCLPFAFGIENGIGGRLKWRNQTILRFILNAI